LLGFFLFSLEVPLDTSGIIICEHCDTVHRRQPLRAREAARCVRCGAELYRDRRFDVEAMLALTLTSLIVFVIANAYPIVAIELHGERSQATLVRAVLAAYDAGIGPVAIAAALMVFLFPLMQIALFLYVLLPLRRGRVPRRFAEAMHLLQQVGPWSMVEVFMLGILVAVVKLTALVSVTPQPGLWGFAVLTCVLTALNSFDLRELWARAMEPRR
jgi:paraquat-inducible protein A